MTLLPVEDAQRLLSMHPKTLCHWLSMAHLPLAAYHSDARKRCVVQADLLAVARLHSRPLPPLSAGATLEHDPVQAHVATLQHHLVRLTLDLLPERTGNADQQIQSLAVLASQPLALVQQLQQSTMENPSPPERRLLPVARVLPHDGADRIWRIGPLCCCLPEALRPVPGPRFATVV